MTARVLTLRKPSGEFIRKQAAAPTNCPGVYRYPLPDEHESCWKAEDEDWCDGDCGEATTFSWRLVCEAGVALSTWAYDKATIETITSRLAEAELIDFTLPLAEVVEAARGPHNAALHRMISPFDIGPVSDPVTTAASPPADAATAPSSASTPTPTPTPKEDTP